MNAPAKVAPRERPIPFTGPMVRAILDGSKTMTRRLVTKATSECGSAQWEQLDIAKAFPQTNNSKLMAPVLDTRGGLDDSLHRIYARRQAGDRLWVRERMRVVSVKAPRGRWSVRVRYEADESESAWLEYPERLKSLPVVGKCLAYGGYREASRLTLDVASVRVERLQDITEEDARAEGVTPLGPSVGAGQPILDTPRRGRTHGTHPHVLAFAVLWDTFNGKRAAWSSNPFVWVVHFLRVCQCESDIEDPGDHLPSCPWNDPNYGVGFP